MLLNGSSALLGLAGSVAATAVAGWVAPVLLCASATLIGRSFWVIYVRKIHTRATVFIAWFSLVFMVSFWSIYLAAGGW
jgi:hypothetical protein